MFVSNSHIISSFSRDQAKTLHYFWELEEARTPDWVEAIKDPKPPGKIAPWAITVISYKWGWQLKQDLRWTGEWGHWGNFIFPSCGKRQTKSLLKMSTFNPCKLWICNIMQQKELWIKVTDSRPYLRIRQRGNPGSFGPRKLHGSVKVVKEDKRVD